MLLKQQQRLSWAEAGDEDEVEQKELRIVVLKHMFKPGSLNSRLICDDATIACRQQH